MDPTGALIPHERIDRTIILLRGQRVMLDKDLASLYGVATRVLLQAVRRNANRFPSDFMFQLSKDELENWRSQIVTSNPGAKMGLRRRPHAFTEQGVAMLSSVLKSERAVRVNIEIMRAFVRMRQILAAHAELAVKLAALETKYDSQFKVVFDAIRALMEPSAVEPKRRPDADGMPAHGANRSARSRSTERNSTRLTRPSASGRS
jgi:hypothetical protein